ncbi:hypothetical protein HC891_26910 [Candidatus Gracilibacteria bacterium]|nr:hypothetical protein [Candidatus Gracilibacteria bacterium]
MLLPPFFLGPAETAILAHLKHVIGSVQIPVIVQYAQRRPECASRPRCF